MSKPWFFLRWLSIFLLICNISLFLFYLFIFNGLIDMVTKIHNMKTKLRIQIRNEVIGKCKPKLEYNVHCMSYQLAEIYIECNWRKFIERGIVFIYLFYYSIVGRQGIRIMYVSIRNTERCLLSYKTLRVGYDLKFL